MRYLDELPLLPRPRKVTRRYGTFERGAIDIYHVATQCVPSLGPQAYRLNIYSDEVRIEGGDNAGIFYGRMTLRQILRLYPYEMPCGTIEDCPDIRIRGVMLDISRDKVPTLETLRMLVDMLAEWKVNHLQLYMEHTFAYRNHPAVWAQADPLTADQIRDLDDYCRDRCVELAPNQNSFGHFERWLKHPRYRPLAECPDGFQTDNGRWREPTTLDPTNPQSLELIDGLYAELLPNFRSCRIHIGCDETWELGRGRSKAAVERQGLATVYFEHLDKLKKLAYQHNHYPLYWGDMVWNHFPDRVAKLDREMVHVDWGYYRLYPFHDHAQKLAEAHIPFWLAPGTSTWCCLTGCNEAGIGSNRSAVRAAREFGSKGVLNTDWGDFGHWQTLPVSFIGLAAGAALAWNEADNTDEVIRGALDAQVFHDSAGVMGQAAYDLADTWMHVSENATAASHLHQILADGPAFVPPANVTPATLSAAEEYLQSIVDRMRATRMLRLDNALIVSEFTHNAFMAMTACRLGRLLLTKNNEASAWAGLTADFERIVTEHRRVWLARNRPGGLEDSLRVLEQRLAECKQKV